mgnify:CR=1 FL=1
MAFENLKVKIYADGAKIEDMLAAYNGGTARGFTTNPSLMKKAGITAAISAVWMRLAI